jgi:hypothetical protein
MNTIMFEMESELLEAVTGLIWTQAPLSRCLLCHKELQPRTHRLDLELPTRIGSASIMLHHCAWCHAPVIGTLSNLEQVLHTRAAIATTKHTELFEITAFCLDGQWLAVEVLTDSEHGSVHWDVFARMLETQIEMAETETILCRFSPDNSE